MHEVGIVNGILDTVIRAARGAGASRAVLVTLRIGDMTEVVREALDFAWETFRDEDPLTRGCALAVEEVHPQSECLDCGEVFEHDRFHCRCPQCGGANVRLRPRARHRKYRNRTPRRLARQPPGYGV